jgi:hypothetical protein
LNCSQGAIKRPNHWKLKRGVHPLHMWRHQQQNLVMPHFALLVSSFYTPFMHTHFRHFAEAPSHYSAISSITKMVRYQWGLKPLIPTGSNSKQGLGPCRPNKFGSKLGLTPCRLASFGPTYQTSFAWEWKDLPFLYT